uniref:HTH La-type RNA-binding domain-containing protein n=1 Tax=Ananas comosus var. bracteatus TaxID=296719 RepID=A0A6V7PYG3_ANACO|nr:unnamed protein product [Ananas comosus var. bracteatus]
MDEQGWVPLSLIASFNKVREITNSLEFIVETVQLSTVAELQGDKIRRRNDWMNWVLPKPNNIISASGPSSPATPASAATNVDTLSAHFQTFGLDAMNIRSRMRDQLVQIQFLTDQHLVIILIPGHKGGIFTAMGKSCFYWAY